VVLGQGVGEHAAACVAGVTSLETALQLALRPDLPGPAADQPSRIAIVSAGEAKAGMTPPQRFAAALRGLAAADRCDVFLEVGPPAHLLDVGRECLPDHAALWLPSLESGRRARRSMLDSLGALYLKGADPDLREAYRGHPCRIVSLPTYPFQRRHHWCSSPAIERRSVSPGHPLLGSRLRSAVARSEIEYEARIIPRRLPFALSASAWLEMALAAGAELLGEGVVAVSDFRIGTAAASHPKGELALHLVLRPQGDQRYHFEILGSGAAADHWVSHASGVLDAGSPADPAPDQLDAIRARLAREQPLASVATPPEALTRLWVGFGEALGEIRLPDRYDLAFKLHPALLDASLQVAAAALASGSSAAHRQAVSIDRLSWHATPGDCLFTHAVLRATDLERIPVVDLSLLSADGALLATIAGLRLGAATAAEPIVENPLRDGLYEVHWQPQPLPGVPARGEDFLGHWLIFADRGGVADRVSDLLRARGNDTTLIRWSDHAAPDYRRVLLAAFAGKLPLRGMVHLWALDAGLTEQADTGALRTGIERGCRSALELTQALIAMQPTTLPLLWFASRGAVDTGDAPAIASPDGLVQAPLWGFAKVLASEHGEIPVRMIDLDPDRAADLTPLIDELLSSGGSGEDRVAFRSGGRLVGRLVRGALDDGARGSIRTDRSYLITGGLGEIGLQLAGWLIGQGARHLVLLGRGTGSPQAQAKLRALESAGARILVVQADVAQADAVAAVLARLGTDLPPLSGVFHAAGVVADRLLVQHSWPLFETVFAPKVEGAWVLHQLTRHLPLDFFVLFSSASTLLGGAGLANYVAANEFLDALAGYRRGLGLAALSIDWGPWAETGMAKDVGSSREAEWLAVGMHPLPPAAALHALGRALDGWTGRIGIMALDWSRMARHPSRRSLGHFADLLLPRGEPKPAPGQPSMRRRIEAAPGSARRSLLLSYVRAEAGSVIGWASGEPFSVNQGFFDLGMDSLQANELRNRLQSGLGCALPPTVVFKFPTVAALSTHLAQDVFGAEPVDGRAGEPSPDRSMAVDDADVVANIGRELVQLEKLLGG
jgi:acyl transferase domain-containing protein